MLGHDFADALSRGLALTAAFAAACASAMPISTDSDAKPIALTDSNKVEITYSKSVTPSPRDIALAAEAGKIFCKFNSSRWKCVSGTTVDVYLSSNDQDHCSMAVTADKFDVKDPNDVRLTSSFVYCTVAGLLALDQKALEGRR